MKYLVLAELSKPANAADIGWDELMRSESDYALQMMARGALVEMWRIPGRAASYSVWEASDHDEIHAALAAAPLYEHLRFTVTPLATHPSVARFADASARRTIST